MCSIRTAQGSHMCGCTLVASTAVVTAAHCKQLAGTANPVVYLGTDFQDPYDGIQTLNQMGKLYM